MYILRFFDYSSDEIYVALLENRQLLTNFSE